MLGRFIGPDAERVTVRELAQDYLNDYRVNARKSIDKAERMVTRFDYDDQEQDSELMAYFGDWKAHSVASDAVKKYISLRLEQGAANATINCELAALKRMYSLGFAGGENLPEALYPDASREQRSPGLFRARRVYSL